MVKKNEIYNIIKDTVGELSDVDFNYDTKLISSGYIDSFELMELIQRLRDDLSLDIDLKKLDISDFDTVENIYKYICGDDYE